MKKKLIEEYNWGVYVWKTPDKKIVQNEDGQVLMVMSRKDDFVQMEKLRKAAKSYGVEEGSPLFMGGHRPITDEEHERQMDRLLNGLIPDDLDYAAITEDLNTRKKNGTL
jgi:hypothetical protein